VFFSAPSSSFSFADALWVCLNPWIS
jgi:hypothetical protein